VQRTYHAAGSFWATIAGMCLICVEIAKGAMTATEGRRALGEMRTKIGKDHAAEVETKLRESEAKADPTKTP
jgi:hypothetical protein